MSSSLTQQSTNAVFVQDHNTASPTIPKCLCGLDAISMPVKKEGRNKGKYFWRCPKFNTLQNDFKCDYFRWVDQRHPFPNPPLFSFFTKPAVSPTLTLTEANVGSASTSSQPTDTVVDVDRTRLDDVESGVVPTSPHYQNASSSSKGKEPEHGHLGPEVLQRNSPSLIQQQQQQPRPIAIPKSRTRLPLDPESGIAQFSTEQMIAIVTQHLNRQEYFAASQERSCKNALSELQETQRQIATLKDEMSLLQRENNVLQREKDLLKRTLDDTKAEIEAHKRQKV